MHTRTLCLLLGFAGSAAFAPVPTPVTEITPPLSVESAQRVTPSKLRPTDLAEVRELNGGAWAPDGKSFVISANLEGRFNLWRIDVSGGAPVRLTSSRERQTPRFVTRDGWVVFTHDTDGDELYDVLMVPLAGGDMRNITASNDYSEDYPVLSPDGQFIAVSRRSITGIIADLAVVDRNARTVRQLTQEKDISKVWYPAGWSSDGKSIIATRTDLAETVGAIYRVNVETGEQTALSDTSPDAYTAAADVSPDGKHIAVISSTRSGQVETGLMETASGKVRWLGAKAWPEAAYSFSADGRRLLLANGVDARAELSVVDVDTLSAKSIALPAGTNVPASRGGAWNDRGQILAIHDSASTPAEYWSADVTTGAATRLTQLSPADLNMDSVARTQIVSYRSADGTPVSAVLTVPVNMPRNGQNRAIVMVHGGPALQSKDNFHHPALMLAMEGFIVLQPNYRGSIGYGRAFQQSVFKDAGGGDLDDVVAGAEFLIATGYAHPRRIGITGGSYGGFMTLMALGKRPDVFQAGVCEYGIIDWFSMWENTIGGLREYQRSLIGDPVADKELYKIQSPITYAESIRAPLLLLHGENDPQVPLSQAEKVVEIVGGRGGTVAYKYYANEGHGFSKSENQADATDRMLGWFKAYLTRE